MADSTYWERRTERRLNVRFGATLRWTDESGKEVVESTHTFSISDTGAGLLTTQPPPVGQKARITLDVGGILGSSVGEVRWVAPGNAGFWVGMSFRA